MILMNVDESLVYSFIILFQNLIFYRHSIKFIYNNLREKISKRKLFKINYKNLKGLKRLIKIFFFEILELREANKF